MDKKRSSKILAKADGETVAAISKEFRETCGIVIIKEPSKTLAMIKMRDPVKAALFYLGEVIVTEAVVELDGTKGAAVLMGDDAEKTLNIAILDAAMNKGIFTDEEKLLTLERQQAELEQKEHAMHLKTMVSFSSMDQEAPK
jgi:alpha-D-ribose 1-methylphosphonate 5-triphosphate synthase subunit PhnG